MASKDDNKKIPKNIKKTEATESFLGSDNANDLIVRKLDSTQAHSYQSKVRFDGATEFTSNKYSDRIFKDRIAACREAYDHSGIIGNAIDLMVDFSIEDFTIFHENKPIQRFYQKWAEKINLWKIAELILKSYFRDGTVPILSYRGRIKKGEFVKLQKAVAAVSNGKDLFVDKTIDNKVIPYNYSILDILKINKYGSELLGNVHYEYTIAGDDVGFLKSGKDAASIEKMRKVLGINTYDHLINTGRLVLPNDRLTMISYKKDQYRRWANPMFWRVIDDIKFKRLLRDMDISVAENVINTITIFALGDTANGFPPTPGMLTKFRQLLQSAPTKSKNLVWNDLVSIKAEYPPVEKILGDKKYKQVDADIRSGIGISEIILGGPGGTNFSNSFLSVKTLLERLEGGRAALVAWLFGEINGIAKSMGFKKPAWIKMKQMSLVDEESEKKLLLELVDRNMISYETCIDRFGENFAIELRRMKDEDSLRKRNSKRYPFTITKLGKFGPNIQDPSLLLNGGIIDQETVMKSKETKKLPASQEKNGQKGGRPIKTKSPQKKNQTPRNKPLGQSVSSDNVTISLKEFKTGCEIFDELYKILSRARDRNNNIIGESQVLNTISAVINYFSTPEEVNVASLNKIFQTIAPQKLERCVRDVEKSLIAKFRKKHNRAPNTKERKDLTSSAWAICRKSTGL